MLTLSRTHTDSTILPGPDAVRQRCEWRRPLCRGRVTYHQRVQYGEGKRGKGKKGKENLKLDKEVPNNTKGTAIRPRAVRCAARCCEVCDRIHMPMSQRSVPRRTAHRSQPSPATLPALQWRRRHAPGAVDAVAVPWSVDPQAGRAGPDDLFMLIDDSVCQCPGNGIVTAVRRCHRTQDGFAPANSAIIMRR